MSGESGAGAQVRTSCNSIFRCMEAFYLRMPQPIGRFSSPALLIPGGSLSDEKRAHLELSGAPFTDDLHLISWKMRRGRWDRPLVAAKGKRQMS